MFCDPSWISVFLPVGTEAMLSALSLCSCCVAGTQRFYFLSLWWYVLNVRYPWPSQFPVCSWVLSSHFSPCLFTKPSSASAHGSWLISVCYPSPKNLSLFLHKMPQFSFFFFFSCHLQLENRNLLSQSAAWLRAFLHTFLLWYFPVFWGTVYSSHYLRESVFVPESSQPWLCRFLIFWPS